MDKDEGLESKSSQYAAGNQQLVVIRQLFKVAATFHHIDELFLWLAYAIVERFGVQVTAFWAPRTGQAGIALRAIAYQDTSIPQYIVTNNQISAAAERIIREQHHYRLTDVSSAFSPHQANLLNRYGLNYCYGYYLSSQPPRNSSVSESTSPLLTASVLLFLRYAPSQHFLPSLGPILEQALPIAKNQGLLPPAASLAQLAGPATSPQRQSQPDLLGLTPRRSQNIELMRSSNPLASSVDIADEQARRLYAAIDGRKNLAELSSITSLNPKEIYAVVHTLLTQHRIQLYEPGGKPVDSSLFLTDP